MNKIVFKHSSSDITSLSVAGNFSQWQVVPMVQNAAQKQWEYQLNDFELKNCSTSGDQNRVYFKFVDGNDNWFTDDNFAKEIDEHGNENNVMYLGKNPAIKASSANVDPAASSGEGESIEREATSSPNPTPVLPAQIRNFEEAPVVISKSDVEGYDEGIQQDQPATNNSTDPPNSADTGISKLADSTGYKGLLHSIITFFRRLFYGWFGMCDKHEESNRSGAS